MQEKFKIEMTLEELADIQYQIWCFWMKYILSCGTFREITINDRIYENFVVSSEIIELWRHQLNTSYKELSEEEKELDRTVVRKFLLKNYNESKS